MKIIKRGLKQRKLVAVITNHDDDIYCFRKELIESIQKMGFDILISCPYGEKLELMSEIKFIHDNARIDRRGTNPISDLRLLFHYNRVFRKYKPDVILTYTVKPNIYASLAASRLGIPYINNITGFGSILKMNKWIYFLIMHLFKIAFNHSSCVFFQNKENMDFAVKEKLLVGDYKLLPGSGVNIKRFPLQNYPDGGNGINGKPIIFNYIGRVLHDKGIDDYIEAAIRIKEKYPKTEFNVIGFIEPTEKHYREQLEILEEKNIVIYKGQQKDVRPFIARAHATIHPSTYGEGMSNVLLESAASGRVLITTDNPGCKETVDDNVNGYIYHGGNIDELVEKIEMFLLISNEERKSMGIKSRDKIKKTFNRDLVINAYLEKIQELVNDD